MYKIFWKRLIHYLNCINVPILHFIENPSTQFAQMTALVKFSENFCSEFEASIQELESRNKRELIELSFLHQNYKRLMNRLDLYKQHGEFEKKAKKKVSRAIRKRKFDRIIQSTYENDI